MHKNALGRRIIQSNLERSFVKGYMEKATHNLEVAKILKVISDSRKIRESIKINLDFSSYDWVIISGYYAMYMAATAAIAKKMLKSENHELTIVALAYHYTLHGNLDKKYIGLIEKARKLEKEYIEDIKKARISRRLVQYKITKKFGKDAAQDLLDSATKFVNKIREIIVE